MNTIRIFISSPSDVADERQITGKVIERLQGKYWSFVRLDDVFWEHKVIRSTAHYQDELVSPANCDIVVGILWSRLGSLMPEKFRKASGARYESGTEWELEIAFEAYAQSLERSPDKSTAKPDIVVYRRTQPLPHEQDPSKSALASKEFRRVEAYLHTNYKFADGTIKRPVTQYSNLDQFEKQLYRNLEELILRKIPTLSPGFDPPPISGSPFKGLQSFAFRDSDRFFGRNREIREIQQRLVASASKGFAFILIYGGSGYGKSSLMRAGMAPILTRPGGAFDSNHSWRRVPFQPSKGEGTLCDRLAGALLQEASEKDLDTSKTNKYWPLIGLPELRSVADEWQASYPIWDHLALSGFFTDPEKRDSVIKRITQALEMLDSHLLLELDQLEEIFTGPEFDDHQRAVFLTTISELCQSGRTWVVATMRSEFFPRVAEQPELFDLVGRDRGYILPPPDRQSLSEMIRYPAMAARLEFERRVEEITIAGEFAKHDYLHDQILADAESSPDALPLLEFTLQQLYEQRDGHLLNWKSYAKAGGLKGAIAQRATAVYESLKPFAREARHRIFAALVHIDSILGTVTRKRASLEELRKHPGSGDFIGAFLEAHLLVTDEDVQTRKPVVALAHEALISNWSELTDWIKDHRTDLLARQRFSEQAELWDGNAQQKSYLLSEARLAEAERVVESSLFELRDRETLYVRLSRKRARRNRKALQISVVTFAILAVVASFSGWQAKKKGDEALQNGEEAINQRNEAIAQKQLAEENASKARNRLLQVARSEVGAGSASLIRGRWSEAIASFARAISLDPSNQDAQDSLYLSILYGKRDEGLMPMADLENGRFATSYTFSPDGGRVVADSNDYYVSDDPPKGSLQIYSSENGEKVGPERTFYSSIAQLAFSENGSLLIVATETRVILIDPTSGSIIKELAHPRRVTAFAISPNNDFIITATSPSEAVREAQSKSDATLKRPEISTNSIPKAPSPASCHLWHWTLTGETTHRPPMETRGEIEELHLSADSLVSERSDAVDCWTAGPNGLIFRGTYVFPIDRVASAGMEAVALAPDGSRVVITHKGKVFLIATRSATAVKPRNKIHTKSAAALNPAKLAQWYTAEENKLIVRNLSDGTVVKAISVGFTINTIKLSPDGTRAWLFAEEGNESLIVDLIGDAEAIPLSDYDDGAFSPNGLFIVGRRETSLDVFLLSNMSLLGQHVTNRKWGGGATAFSSDGSRILSEDSRSRWDPSRALIYHLATGPFPPVERSAIGRSKPTTSDLSDDGTASETVEGQKYHDLQPEPMTDPDALPVWRNTFVGPPVRIITLMCIGEKDTPTSRYFLHVRGDANIDGDRSPLQLDGPCDDARLSPDGRLLAIVNEGAEIYDRATGKILYTLSDSLQNIGQVAFTSDGTTIVTATRGGTNDPNHIQAWNACNGEPLWSPIYFGHAANIRLIGNGDRFLAEPDNGTSLGDQESIHRIYSTATGLRIGPDFLRFIPGDIYNTTGASIPDTSSFSVLPIHWTHGTRNLHIRPTQPIGGTLAISIASIAGGIATDTRTDSFRTLTLSERKSLLDQVLANSELPADWRRALGRALPLGPNTQWGESDDTTLMQHVDRLMATGSPAVIPEALLLLPGDPRPLFHLTGDIDFSPEDPAQHEDSDDEEDPADIVRRNWLRDYAFDRLSAHPVTALALAASWEENDRPDLASRAIDAAARSKPPATDHAATEARKAALDKLGRK